MFSRVARLGLVMLLVGCYQRNEPPPAGSGSKPLSAPAVNTPSPVPSPAELEAAKAQAQSLLAENKPFEFSFKLPSIDGKTISSADYAGKVLIVDFWGIWCPPCRKEVPHFIALHKKYRDKGLEIVGINYENVDKDKVKETIKSFVDKNGVTYPCLIGDDATQRRVPDLEGFPTTLFLDRSGKVRAKIVGYHDLADLEAVVTALLDEKPAPKGK